MRLLEALIALIILVLEESMSVDILKKKFTLADVVDELTAFINNMIASWLFVYLLKLLLADLQGVDEDVREASGKHIL